MLLAGVAFGISSIGAALARVRILAIVFGLFGAIGSVVQLSDASAGPDIAACWIVIGISLIGVAAGIVRSRRIGDQS